MSTFDCLVPYLKNQKEAYGNSVKDTVKSARQALKTYSANDWNNFIAAKMTDSGIEINKSKKKLGTTMADSQQARNARAYCILNNLIFGKNPNESGAPKMLQVLGGAGSGKTTQINKMLDNKETISGTPINPESTVVIDVPAMMLEIADQENFSDEQIKTPEFSSTVRHEASLLAKTAVEIALEKGLDIIYEGADVPEFERQTKLAQDKGYDVEAAVFYTSSPETALKRVAKKFDLHGGTLPPVGVVLDKTETISQIALDTAFDELDIPTNLYETSPENGMVAHVIKRQRGMIPELADKTRTSEYMSFVRTPKNIAELSKELDFKAASKEETVIGHGKPPTPSENTVSNSFELPFQGKQR
jgi:predicted ABC-type ATPase